MRGERVFKSGTVNKLAKINNLSENEILEKIAELSESNLEKAEIFRRLSDGKGSPSTHCSGIVEGELVASYLSKKKPKKHRFR